MIRRSFALLVHSHTKKKGQNPKRPASLGRHYSRSYIRYGVGGLGISTYSTRKDRRFVVNKLPMPPQSLPSPSPSSSSLPSDSDKLGLSRTTKSLSPHWRTFALEDGGVLFTHPSHEQVMKWGQQVFRKEAEVTGRTAMSDWTDSRIQAILADNTLENYSIKYWRQRHMWNLIKSHGRLHRQWGFKSKTVTDMRSSLF
jgi:hypothetical protein